MLRKMCEICGCKYDDVSRAAMTVGDCSLCPNQFEYTDDNGNKRKVCNIMEEDLRPCVKF